MIEINTQPTFIAIDLETTGLDARKDKIVEIGAAKFDETGAPIDKFCSLVNPGCKIPKEATAIHTITDSMVDGAPVLEQVWADFLRWAGDDFILVAHNAEFEAWFLYYGLENEVETRRLRFIDTLRLSKRRIKDQESYALSALVEDFDGQGHRALPDALACIKLFIRIQSSYKSNKIPLKTNILRLSDFGSYTSPDEPSRRQQAYIAKLGGDPFSVSTKIEASNYIDELKNDVATHDKIRRRKATKNIKPPRESSNSILVFVVVIFVLIAWIYFK